MTTPLSLLFGVHAHQPSDNFADVLEHAVDRCYRPFLETLDAYPRFRFSFHCSGPLFTFLCDRVPDVVHRLERMVARGQTELFGGGDAEPVLAAIPERDRRGQLRAFSDRLEARFGRRPRGAWLTERAWEATIVPSLAACGIDYVTVDDYHFLCTGRESSELTGYFTTEEDGRRLDLFPISEALRYKIPFAPATDVVSYLEGLDTARSGVAAIYFDDIEKFGIWPDTHEWVYGRGWLAAFLQGVLASTRIETRTYGEFRAAHRTRGVVYLPSTAYIEMNEWTLPARAAARYAALVRHERAQHRYDDAKPFLRGGIWRNFLSRYPEANWLHKRMLALSDRVASLPGPADAALTRLLYAAQANDAYWHGLFGGLYLPHLRRGLYRALIGLEHALDRLHPRPPRGASDLDCDGVDEVFLTGAALQAVLRDDGLGAVIELDSYAFCQNFGDTLRRHAEHYHQAIEAGDQRAEPSEGIASAHDRVAYRDRIAAEDLVPDLQARTLFVDRLQAIDGTVTPIADYVLADDAGLQPSATLHAACAGAEIDKCVALAGNRLDVSYRVRVAGPARWIVELDLALPSCDGVGGRVVHDGAILGGFADEHTLADATAMTLDDTFMAGRVELHCSPPARIVTRPYRTVSQSEQGFEKIMQSITLTLSWPLDATECRIAVGLAIAGPGHADPPSVMGGAGLLPSPA